MSIFSRHKSELVAPEQALPGRSERFFTLDEKHLVLARTPAQKTLAEQAIEQYAAGQAALIRQTFASSDGSAARDAYCETHG